MKCVINPSISTVKCQENATASATSGVSVYTESMSFITIVNILEYCIRYCSRSAFGEG